MTHKEQTKQFNEAHNRAITYDEAKELTEHWLMDAALLYAESAALQERRKMELIIKDGFNKFEKQNRIIEELPILLRHILDEIEKL